jgi:hypothetical protein
LSSLGLNTFPSPPSLFDASFLRPRGYYPGQTSVIYYSDTTMFSSSVTTIVISLTLLASQTLGTPNPSRPSKHARWGQVPRTLLDPDFLKRGNLDAREAVPAVGISPLEKKDIFQRQTGPCSATEVECQTSQCCPSGYNCYYVGSVGGCCPAGETCTSKSGFIRKRLAFSITPSFLQVSL